MSSSRNRYFDSHVRLHPIDQARGDFSVDQVIGEAQRDAQNQQDAAHDGGALDEDFAVIARKLEIAVDEDFDEEGAERGERRGFGERAEATEQAHDHDHRQREFPLGAPYGRGPASRRENGSRTAPLLIPMRTPTKAMQEIISSSGRIAPMKSRSMGVCE